jgi:hypothetical protein
MRLLTLYGLGEGSISLYKQTPTMSVGYRMVLGIRPSGSISYEFRKIGAEICRAL